MIKLQKHTLLFCALKGPLLLLFVNSLRRSDAHNNFTDTLCVVSIYFQKTKKKLYGNISLSTFWQWSARLPHCEKTSSVENYSGKFCLYIFTCTLQCTCIGLTQWGTVSVRELLNDRLIAVTGQLISSVICRTTK